MNQLDQLKQYSTVVADTGSFKQLSGFAPRDVSTDPSLILQAARQADYAPLVKQAVAATTKGRTPEHLADEVLVRFGLEILQLVPGRVSTGVDARLAFDTAATIARARRLIDRYERAGIGRERVLITMAATWEGIQAARALEHEGIHCNLTLVFAFCQAVACAEAGATLVSPGVGPIHDGYQAQADSAWDVAAMAGVNDPGVQFVTRVYTYYKHFGISTEVMGTSFRNLGQILALAGCDRLAIGPALLAQLQASQAPLARVLDATMARAQPVHALTYNEAGFRYALNADALATEKLAEGIRNFAADAAQLDQLIEDLT